jgi:enamine deaminase RidA (YjgF/YER057c/UK114 family)
MPERVNISSNTRWESVAGYSRAVRVGSIVEVAGTTAVDEEGQIVAPGDPYAQTRYILGKIERALRATGAQLTDVVRTRMFVIDIQHWEEVARAHGEVFRDIRPAATLVQVSALIEPELVVEIEVTAVMG